VSHNLGFGVPDAGQAVRLAQTWSNRPSLVTVAFADTNSAAIPENGMRVRATGPLILSSLTNITAVPPGLPPARGPRADAPTPSLPLVDVGLATNALATNLTGKAALIQRGDNTFQEKVDFAAAAGAAFAIVFNNTGGTSLIQMDLSEFTPIPAVFINQNDGEGLRTRLQGGLSTDVSLFLEAASRTFNVTNTLVCEHVGVTVTCDHPVRGDLRITLISPQRTVSVLQHPNFDANPGPADWTYYTTHDFYESSVGDWIVQVSDEVAMEVGSVQAVTLTITGVPIIDADADGLDDNWEMAHFNSLAQGPRDDPDGDGDNNAREQVMGTDPGAVDAIFRIDLSAWDDRLTRLCWPAVTNRTYDILAGGDVGSPLTLLTNVPGRFREAEWFTPYTNLANRFFRVRTAP
jgi:subtilisin-like proprotein convertase family protein